MKIPPVATLFMLPLGFPLILLYITIFPGLSPTWVRNDGDYEKKIKKQTLKQKEALKYFQEVGLIKVENGRVSTNLSIESL